MAQPIRNIRKRPKSKVKVIKNSQIKRKHPEYGVSKLENRFAKEFLDKEGYTYIRQYKAEDIGRYYDFAVQAENGLTFLIEVDGDYFHGHNLVYEEKNPMQKRNEKVDKIKDEWAEMRGIPLVRIWESDINNNPKKVRNLLKKLIKSELDKQDKKNRKAQRH